MNRLSRAIVIAALFGSSVAYAQDEKMSAEADARFKEGIALSQRGKYEDARVKYLQVLALGNYPNVNLNLAIAEEATNRPADALKHLKIYLANPKADPKKSDALRREMVPVLAGRTGHLRVKADSGLDITVDGAAAGRAPVSDVVDVMPGAHAVVTSAKRADVSVAAGETKDIDLTSPAPPATTSAHVGSGLDGDPSTTPPPPPTSADNPSTDTVVWTPVRIVVTAGLAVAGGVFLGLAASAAGSHSDAKTRIDADTAALGNNSNACAGAANPTCADLSDAYSTRDSAATRETAFFIIGGVALVGAIGTAVAWYLNPLQPAGSSFIMPTATRTGMGLSWSGSF